MKKAKARLGRPKKENVLREPNGRISRAKHNPQDLAVKVRAQKFNLTLDQAKDPRSESWAGRLSFIGGSLGISEEQYKAADHYIALYNNYRKAILSPSAHYDSDSQNLGTNEELDYETWARRAKLKFEKANIAIQKAQFDHPNDNLYAAIQYGVLENIEMPHLIGSLRIALNALYQHFFATAQYHIKNNNNVTLAGQRYANVNTILTRDNSRYPLRSIRSF